MALPKLYDRIVWHNNTTPALNEDNLNAMSKGLDDVDDRLIDLAGTIMEDVPQIIEDIAILEPAIESIDENVARAEAAAESAEQYAEEIAPPIEVVKDFAPIITLEDAINKPVKDLKVKVDPVQDLHGYTKPWVGGAGKNKLRFPYFGTSSGAVTIKDDGQIVVNGTLSERTYINLEEKHTGYAPPSGTWIISKGTTTGSIKIVVNAYNDGIYVRTLVESNSDNVSFSVDYNGYNNLSVYLDIAANQTLNVTIKPMIRASGTSDTWESYSNICPITGHSQAKVTRAGKNLLPYPYQDTTKTTANVQYTDNGDGTITANGTANSSGTGFIIYPSSGTYGKNNFKGMVLNGVTGGATNTYNIFIAYSNDSTSWAADGPQLGSGEAVISSDYDYIRIVIKANNGAQLNNVVFKPMIRPADFEDSSFESYMGEVFTINLDGTRYLCEYSATDGALKVLGLYDEITSVNRGTITSGKFCWYVTDYATTIQKPSSSDLVANIKCNFAPTASFNNLAAGTESIAVHSNGNVFLYIKPWEDMTATQVNAILAETPLQIVYELATPQTITLTPTEVDLLLGYNTLFADTGDLSLTYDASGVLRIAGPLEERVDALENSPEIISNANGEAYKFPSGVLICTKQYKATSLACTNSWGVLYESPLIDFGDWAYPFITSPDSVSAIVIGGQGGWPEYLVGGTATKVGKTYLVRPTANTADTIFGITGIGRWK